LISSFALDSESLDLQTSVSFVNALIGGPSLLFQSAPREPRRALRGEPRSARFEVGVSETAEDEPKLVFVRPLKVSTFETPEHVCWEAQELNLTAFGADDSDAYAALSEQIETLVEHYLSKSDAELTPRARAIRDFLKSLLG
jgi:hypothetical protein